MFDLILEEAASALVKDRIVLYLVVGVVSVLSLME
jgi:hypothetical protein